MPPSKSEIVDRAKPVPAHFASSPEPTPVALGARRLGGIGVSAAVLGVAFAGPLLKWIRFALSEDRNTYLLLVPVIAAYLAWIKRGDYRLSFRTSALAAIIAAVAGALAFSAVSAIRSPIDQLSLQIFSLLCFLLGAGFAWLGADPIRKFQFPIAFLIFAVPMPTLFGNAIEIFLQHASALAANWMLTLAQTPMLSDGLDFRLPGISIRVAQECSGYNSTCALFIVSIVSGYLFLKSPWKRLALSAAVVPLAILRNGFRITTIALLCVHVDPKLIHSYIHTHGGPIFFALSLIPFFAMLWLLRRSESAGTNAPPAPCNNE